MLKKAMILTILVVVFAISAPIVNAHDYSRDTSDCPLRYASYVFYPIGYVAEWCILRPIHAFVSIPAVGKVCGHEPHPSDNLFGEKNKEIKPKGADKEKTKAKASEIDELKKKIAELENEVKSLGDQNNEKAAEIAKLKEELEQKEKELAELKNGADAKDKEIAALKAELEKMKVEMQDSQKAFSFSLLEGCLFISGSDELTSQGKTILDQVSELIKQKYPDREILVQGHTDNDPIQYSTWKSNWELGSARSLAVLHYLVGEKNVDPSKISASTCGEFRPVADNSTKENKAQNRRSIILVLPKNIQVEKAEVK